MDQILDTPHQEVPSFSYAGFWIRLGAYLIDTVLLWIVNVVISFFYLGSYSIYQSSIPVSLAAMLIGILYFVLMESSERQGTLGKMAVGIKIGDKNGNRISFANALGRYFAKILSALILCIGYLMVAWDDRKQGLHDKLADTYVFEN